jgi:acetylornithine deacetylase
MLVSGFRNNAAYTRTPSPPHCGSHAPMRNRAPTLMEMMATLVGTPSVSSVRPDHDQSNQAVIDHLAGWLEDIGFRVETLPLPDHPGKADLIATLGEGENGLVLAGHTDTVPYDEGRWTHDPFRLTEANGRLYGLGTSDMKAFLALAAETAREFRAEALQAPLILLATADEESSMAGAKLLTEIGRPRARYAVIGEPTGLRPVRMHKGILMEAVRLLGRAGHSSDPSLGLNALEGMHRVLDELLRWRADLQSRYHNSRFAVPVPTLNLGHIRGGDNPNRICPQCEVHFDLRQLPGMDMESLRREMRERIGKRLHDSGLGTEFVSLFPGIPAMETAEGSPIVRAAERLTGYPAAAVAFGTEGPYLQQLGIDTVILGPGNIEQAHQADEFLSVDRIQPTLNILRRFVETFCVREGDQGDIAR